MKKIKLLFVFGIIIGLVFIGFGIQGKKYVSVDKKEVGEEYNDKYGLAYLHLDFYKYGENNKFLAGTKFKLSSYNNIYKLYPSEYYDNNNVKISGYRTYDSEVDYENAYSVLSDKQKALASSITTTNDLKKFNNGKYVVCDEMYPIGGVEKRRMENGYYCVVPLPTVFYLEETKVPSGYAKTKVLVPGQIFLGYRVKDYQVTEMLERKDDTYYRVEDYFGNDTYDVELSVVGVVNFNSYIEYGDVDEEVLVGTDMEEAFDLMYANAQGSACNAEKREQNIMNNITMSAPTGIGDYKSVNFCYFSLYNEKGNVSLEVNTSVNDKESLTTTTENEVQYRVTVKNVGNVDSVDNIIVSKLPDGFEYVEGSASNGGIYNSKDHTVSWKVPRINSFEETSLVYKAHIPSNINNLKSYVGESYAQGFGMNNRVESNKAIVSLILNPKTNAPIYGIIITLLITWGVAGYLFLYKKYSVKKKRIRKRKATS